MQKCIVTQDEEIFTFDHIYQKYYGFIFTIFREKTGCLDVAEDLTQETFLKIYKYLGSYSPEKGRFESWARVVAINIWLRWAGKARKIQTEPMVQEPVVELKNTHTEEVDNKLLMDSMLAAIDELQEPMRSYLLYRYVEQKKVKDIARIYNVSESLISRRIIRGLEILRGMLEKRGIGLYQ